MAIEKNKGILGIFSKNKNNLPKKYNFFHSRCSELVNAKICFEQNKNFSIKLVGIKWVVPGTIPVLNLIDLVSGAIITSGDCKRFLMSG